MKRIDKMVTYKWVEILLASCGLITITLASIMKNNHNLLVLGILFLFLCNLFFCINKIEQRFFYLVFQITFFTFIIARPVLGFFENSKWMDKSSQAKENVYFALWLIILSLIAIYLGAIISTYIMEKKGIDYKFDIEKRSYFVLCLQKVSFIAFCITMFFFLGQEFEKLLFMREKNYTEFYIEFKSVLPGLFHTIASFMKYSLCIFLATFPSKKKSTFTLLLFIFSSIPTLIIGIRTNFMLNVLFAIVYYVLRDVKVNKDKWIGRKEKILLGIGGPIVLFSMTLLGYVRSGLEIKSINPFYGIYEFFMSQSVSFEVLAIFYGYQQGLPVHSFQNYTFGGMIDYIRFGTVGQFLFGTTPLPSGNNLRNALESNSMAHHLSYLSKKEAYLDGQGWGTSYLLELFADYGYVGVFLGSLILGGLLILIIYLIKGKWLLNTIILVSLTGIFYMPRGEATGWLSFIVMIQFWLCVGGCAFAAWLLIMMKKIRGENHEK